MLYNNNNKTTHPRKEREGGGAVRLGLGAVELVDAVERRGHKGGQQEEGLGGFGGGGGAVFRGEGRCWMGVDVLQRR